MKEKGKIEKKTLNRDKKNSHKTYIGGQAVLEGVMMRGKTSMATAVRTPSGEITLEALRLNKKKRSKFWSLPFVRGIVNFGSQLIDGTALLMRTAEIYGEFEDEPSKLEKKVAKKMKINPMNLILGFSVALGIVLAVCLFILLPNYLSGLFFSIPSLSGTHPALQSLFEGALMLVIFVLYILGVSAMKDIRRVFMYHGAEHRVISCFEHGLPLTVENAQKMPTAHSRCGTTFMFFVLAISILVFAFVNWGLQALGWWTDNAMLNALIKVPAKLVFVPFVASVAYELLKFLSKYDNWFVKILRAPGMALQKLTTRKPTDDMVECSIMAFEMVVKMDADPTTAEQHFEVKVKMSYVRKKLEEMFGENQESSDIDWLLVDTLGLSRGELKLVDTITGEQYKQILGFASQMKDGKPVQYATGKTEFYGLKMSVNENVLIPRPETELLVEEALKQINARPFETVPKVLDLCCGSGAIGIAIKKNSNANVVCTDISDKAIEVAKANAFLNDAKIEFKIGDCFASVENEKFDFIISNPPYIESEVCKNLDKKVKDFEPMLALDGGKDGLKFYREILQHGFEHLNEGGTIFMEIGFDQGKSIENLFKNFDVKIKKDYNDNARIAVVKRK